MRSTSLVLLAALASLGVFSIVLKQPGSVLVIVLLAVFVPMFIFVLPPTLRYAANIFRSLKRELTWWHGLWLSLLLSSLVFRVRDVDARRESPIDAWAVYRIALVFGPALILGLRLALRITPWAKPMVRGLVGALSMSVLVSLASTFWSVYPAWTFYKSFEFFVDVAVLAAVLATAPSIWAFKSLFNWTWLLFGGLLVTVWAWAILAPDRAFVEGSAVLPKRILGVLPALDQNSVGDLAAILAVVGVSRLVSSRRRREGRVFRWVFFSTVLVTMVLAQTRATIVGFLIAALLILLLSKRLGTIAFLAVAVVLIFSLTSASVVLKVSWERGARPEELENFSGRQKIWEDLWGTFEQRPWTGHGAYAGSMFVERSAYADPTLATALNSYLDVALGAGLFGLIPLVLAVGGTWWILLRMVAILPGTSLERQLALEALGVLTVISVRSFFTVEFVWHPSLEFLVVLGYAELLRQRQSLSAEGFARSLRPLSVACSSPH